MDGQTPLVLPVAMSVHGPNVDAKRFPLKTAQMRRDIKKK